jgi:GWxTD domain-containing protein
MHVRTPHRTTSVLGLACFWLVLAGSSALAADDAITTDLRKWLDGPVRYIAVEEEFKAFKRLKTDDSRAVFIERFWSRRDPSRDTLINEYRQLFWQRVREATELFTDSPGPGWETDRGKIHILLGPPTEAQEDIDADPKLGLGGGRGLLRWIYEGRPGGRKDLDPIVVVPFVRDLTGEYKISYEPKLASVFFDWNSVRGEIQTKYDRWIEETTTPLRSKLSVMLDLGKLQEVPPQEQVLLERVETVEAYRTHALPVELVRFEPPGDTGSLLVITIGLPGDAGSERRPAILAKVLSHDASVPMRVLEEGSFRLEGSGPDRIAQSRILLQPGLWDLTLMTVDPEGGSTGIYRTTIDVRPRGAGLHLSDIALPRSLEPLAYRALVSYEEPFVVGAFRIMPRAGRPLRQGDEIHLFYEIYGGRGPYRISYQVEGKENDGRWTPLGRPSILEGAEGAQGWGLPTGPNWPPGDYRVRVDVADAEGAATSALVPVTLSPATP